jgi:hypothetical protein
MNSIWLCPTSAAREARKILTVQDVFGIGALQKQSFSLALRRRRGKSAALPEIERRAIGRRGGLALPARR